MTPERWERVARVFEAAQACPPPARPALLQRLCGDDAELRAEVDTLLAGAAAASGFLSSPPPLSDGRAPAPTPVWAAGALLAARFEVLRLLGRGGMGEVYAARDRELGIEVALKAVRADLASDARALARFKREVLTARRITHPHVCRIYDLAVEPGPAPAYFLSMELLSGETLAERLRRAGPPPGATARRWLAEIAAGLDAAHAAGVTHRDFKPGNVMFRPGPNGEAEAVITDFGLARWTEPGPGLSSGTQLAGTLAYMAPEQLAGGPVTPATDLYAFGLVAFETLTGQAVFAAGGVPARALGRRGRSCPAPSTLRKGLDRRWDGVIAACLADDPARRASSAAAALAALPPPTRRVPALRRIGRATAIAAAAVGVALAFAVYRYSRVKAEIPPGSEILLTEVTNSTGDPQLNGAGLLLRQQLAQSAHFTLTTPAQEEQQLRRMDEPAAVGLARLAQEPALARQVAMRRGALLVVFANLSRLAGEYRLGIELERVGNDPDAAAGSWTVTETAARKRGLFDAVHAGANWIRQRAGEQPRALASANQPPQDITTPSWQALDYYRQAQADRAARRTPQAIALLRQATVADPGFALAYARLGDILVSQQDYADGYAAYRTALSRANQRRLSRRERLLLQGDYDEDAWNWKGAVQSFQAYAALYPRDPLGWFYQGNPDAQLGEDAAANAAWRRAAALAPRAAYVPGNEAILAIAQGNLNAARRQARQVARLGRSGFAAVLEAEIAFAGGDRAAARRDLAGPARSANAGRRHQALETEACLAAEEGRYGRARAALRRAIADAETSADAAGEAQARVGLAYLALRSGDRAGARREAGLALGLDHSPQNLAAAGALLAESGGLAGARQALALLRPLRFLQPLEAGAANRIRGEILLAQGRTAAGLRALQAAARTGGQLEYPPLYLPRALARAGRREAALRLCEQWTRTPGSIWQTAFLHLPGRFADLTFQAARLSDELGHPDARARWQRFLQLRNGADPGLPEVAYARRRLAALAQSKE